MKLEIDSYFEPDIVWLGEINRRSRKLECTTSVFPASTIQLICSLWHGNNSTWGITLSLTIAGRKLSVLYSVEGLTLEEVARVTRQPVDATRRVIELTRELLRANLAEARIRPAERELRREVVA